MLDEENSTNEFLKQLENVIEQAKDLVSGFLKSATIQKGVIRMAEGFLYSNTIYNFRNNLNEENLREFNISNDELKYVEKEFKTIFERCNKTLESTFNLGEINHDIYQTLRKELKNISENSYNLLLQLEKEIDIISCQKSIDDFKKEVPKLGKEISKGDDWLSTLVLEAFIESKKDIPDSEKISEIIKNVMLKTLPEAAEILSNELKSKSARMLKERQRINRSFEKRLIKRWAKPIDILEMFYVIAFEVGEEFNREYREEAAKNNDYLFDALTRIHARACQVCFEIITLLKNGLADGAHARWRTLHELAIISFFIEEHGQEIAKRFLDYEAVENYRDAVEHQKHCNALGYEPLSSKEFKEIENDYFSTCRKHGKKFNKNYGWIPKNMLSERKFKEIEKSLKIDKFHYFYTLASHNIHAGAKSLKFRLGLFQDSSKSDLLLAGPSNYGLADPGQGAAISLNQVTFCLLASKPSMERLTTMTTMHKIVNEICEAFVEVQFQIEREETEELGTSF